MKVGLVSRHPTARGERQRRDVRLERGRIPLRLLVSNGLGRHLLPDGVPLLSGKCHLLPSTRFVEVYGFVRTQLTGTSYY